MKKQKKKKKKKEKEYKERYDPFIETLFQAHPSIAHIIKLSCVYKEAIITIFRCCRGNCSQSNSLFFPLSLHLLSHSLSLSLLSLLASHLYLGANACNKKRSSRSHPK